MALSLVNIAYQIEPEWDAEDISEEDHAEPVQAQVVFCLLPHTFRYTIICKCYCLCYLLIHGFILIKALIQHRNHMRVHV